MKRAMMINSSYSEMIIVASSSDRSELAMWQLKNKLKAHETFYSCITGYSCSAYIMD